MPPTESHRQRLARVRQQRSERQRLKAAYQELFEQANHIIHQHDPIGIAFVAEDEYEPEVGSILPRLKEAHNADDVRRIVYEEFTHWFDTSSGTEDRYQQLALDLWDLWQHYQGARP